VKWLADKQYPSQLLDDLLGLIGDRTFAVCLLDKQHLGRYADLVNKIRTADPYIDSTDVLVVAHSMVDKECRGLLTFDGQVITSMGLKGVINQHLKDRKSFKITDDPKT